MFTEESALGGLAPQANTRVAPLDRRACRSHGGRHDGRMTSDQLRHLDLRYRRYALLDRESTRAIGVATTRARKHGCWSGQQRRAAARARPHGGRGGVDQWSRRLCTGIHHATTPGHHRLSRAVLFQSAILAACRVVSCAAASWMSGALPARWVPHASTGALAAVCLAYFSF